MVSPQMAFLDLGAPELIIILVILLLLFGSKKLPELSKSLGESMHELRRGANGPISEKKHESENTHPKSSDGPTGQA